MTTYECPKCHQTAEVAPGANGVAHHCPCDRGKIVMFRPLVTSDG